MEPIEASISAVKLKYAPDKRTAIFDIQFQKFEDGSFVLSGETNLPNAKGELLTLLKEENIPFTDSIRILPEAGLNGKTYGFINLSAANIRTKPDHQAELATQAILGTPVKVLKYEDGWYLIQTPDSYIGWVDNDGVAAVTKDDYLSWIKGEKIVYTSHLGFSYTEASKESQSVSDLVNGSILKFLTEENGYYKIEYPDKRTAYIPSTESIFYDTWINSINPQSGKIIADAKKLMGLPYLWGGTSIKGIDCSGFMKTIYFLNGVILPRDASQQALTGEIVEPGENFENLQPGDLLFFGSKAREGKKERVTHVGMYIGNGEYIHSSGKVKINSILAEKPNFNKHYFNGFLRAKRILTSINSNGIFLINSNEFYSGEFNGEQN